MGIIKGKLDRNLANCIASLMEDMEPKPWEKTGKVGPKDTKLKAAAKAMYAARTGGTAKPSVPADLEVPAYEEPADDVPF